MVEKKSWLWQYGLLLILGAICALYFLGNAVSSSSDAGTSNNFLDAKVYADIEGMHIKNNESIDWTDCIAGVNGGVGFGFENAPYKTHGPFSVTAGSEKVIPYRDITASDGTFFDPSSQTVNNAFVECFQSTPKLRIWVGGN